MAPVAAHFYARYAFLYVGNVSLVLCVIPNYGVCHMHSFYSLLCTVYMYMYMCKDIKIEIGCHIRLL